MWDGSGRARGKGQVKGVKSHKNENEGDRYRVVQKGLQKLSLGLTFVSNALTGMSAPHEHRHLLNHDT